MRVTKQTSTSPKSGLTSETRIPRPVNPEIAIDLYHSPACLQVINSSDYQQNSQVRTNGQAKAAPRLIRRERAITTSPYASKCYRIFYNHEHSTDSES
jgi:hypothetical protein